MKRTVLLLCTCVAWPAAAQVGDLLFRDGYEPGAQISVTPVPAFPPQLAGTSSAPLTLTITNVGGLPVALSEIDNSGADADDFVLDLTGTEFSLAPAASTTLAVTFTPGLPWQPGTRQAQLDVLGNVQGGVVALAESGQGVKCDGAAPACSSGCADSDGDGLNDAWEIAGGVDSDNDGLVDGQDALLPGADVAIPDIFVKYDYMVKAGDGAHSHQPPQAALDQVVQAFAAHGVALHFVAPAGGITETVVTTLDPNPTPECAGDSVSTVHDLRATNFDHLQAAYHYMVFAHRAITPDFAHQNSCPSDPFCFAKPKADSTGSADLPGDDAIVAFGVRFDDLNPPEPFLVATTIMHELGHNLGLKHGGPDACAIDKPNYISVMNLNTYQFNGIPVADAPGSSDFRVCAAEADCQPPTVTSGTCATANACHCTTGQALPLGFDYCYRVDYSAFDLPSLNEVSIAPGVGGLDETIGVSGPLGDEDIVFYYRGPSQEVGPSNGAAIDWDGVNGIQTHVSADINNDGGQTNLTTQNDWETSGGQFTRIHLPFQCTAGYGAGLRAAWKTDESNSESMGRDALIRQLRAKASRRTASH